MLVGILQLVEHLITIYPDVECALCLSPYTTSSLRCLLFRDVNRSVWGVSMFYMSNQRREGLAFLRAPRLLGVCHPPSSNARPDAGLVYLAHRIIVEPPPLIGFGRRHLCPRIRAPGSGTSESLHLLFDQGVSLERRLVSHALRRIGPWVVQVGLDVRVVSSSGSGDGARGVEGFSCASISRLLRRASSCLSGHSQ